MRRKVKMQAPVVARAHLHLLQGVHLRIEAGVRRKKRSQSRRNFEQDHLQQVVHQPKEVKAKRNQVVEDDLLVHHAPDDQGLILIPSTEMIDAEMTPEGDIGRDRVPQEQEALATTGKKTEEEGALPPSLLVRDIGPQDDIE